VYKLVLICIEVKVNLSLCLIKDHAIKTYRVMKLELQSFLTSSADKSCQLSFPTILPLDKELSVYVWYEEAGLASETSIL
jgi:hypothetical protein